MIKTMFWNVLEISAACTAVILAVMLFSRLIGSIYGPKGRYLLWLVIIVRLAVPWNAALSQAPVSVDRLVGTVGAAVRTAELKKDNKDLEVLNPQKADKQPVSSGQSAAGNAALVEAGMRIWRNQISGILSLLWAVGVVLYAGWNLTGYMILRRRLRRWEEPVSDRDILLCYQNVCRELDIKNAPALNYCSVLSAPMCAGFARPAIYLSSLNLNADDFYYIFKHELTHYKRHDIIYKGLLLTARSIHFFNPFVHWMAMAAEKDMELSCDAEVVNNCPPEVRREYSLTILKCISESRVSQTALSTHFTGDKERLKRRFCNIMNEKKVRNGKLPAVLAAAAVILLGTLVACGSDQGNKAEPPAEESTSVLWMEEQNDSLSEAQLSDETINNLWKWKTPYIGNNSAVGNMMLRISPYLSYKGFELNTSEEPYGVLINLEVSDWDQYADQGEISLKPFYKQAAILFCLVDNAGYLEVNLGTGGESSSYTFCAFKISREESMSQYFSEEELKQAGESLENFKAFVNSLDSVFPDSSIAVSMEKKD
ncbi:hypothetical protein C0033_06795 [Clostridium sp. chh4-2]|uniref:M56 family metallopeptidase n=1 Tax=Clostridium sp. chh4-2 TaxID=2067550 RepID=UPI000CCF9981|nr:M56 family metallopeptidase [Clostridium sp. chh4-2]PNV62731.1 hypothetical protein C0033_06795 [Clostridium sp. chh4-2]